LPEIAVPDPVGLGRVGCLLKKGSQLSVKLVHKLLASDVYVIVHDIRDVGGDVRVKTPAASVMSALGMGIQLRKRNRLGSACVNLRAASDGLCQAFVFVR
jgi:hypothetical protein